MKRRCRLAAGAALANRIIAWKKKYGGLGLNESRESRHVLEENGKLKYPAADLTVSKPSHSRMKNLSRVASHASRKDLPI